MDALEILKATRKKLSDENVWIKNKASVDANGVEVYPRDESAVCFCTVGAMMSVCDEIEPDTMDWVTGDGAVELKKACRTLQTLLPYDVYDVATYNDISTHSQIMDLLDRGIKKLSKGV